MPRTKIACDTCAKAKVKCTGNVPCENCCKKGIECHVRHPTPSIINVDGQFASYSDVPLSQVTMRTNSDVVLPHPPSDIRAASHFDLFDTLRDDAEVDNLFLGLFDGFDSSMRDIRQALEFPRSLPEPDTTSALVNPVKPIEHNTGLLADPNPLLVDTTASIPFKCVDRA